MHHFTNAEASDHVATRQDRIAEDDAAATITASGKGADQSLVAVWSRRVSATVLAFGLVVQGAVLVHSARQLWFVGDDWDFILRRGTIPGDARSWLEPKNGHWSTLTIMVYRALFAVFGLRDYLPYALVTIVLHLTIAAVWYVVLREARATRLPALTGSWVILFLGAGGEALLYSAAMNHLWSILLGLVGVLLVLRRHHRAWTGAALLGAVMFSNTGLPVVLFVAAFVALREGLRRAAAVAAAPAVAYILWYALYGHTEARTQIPATGQDYLKIPQLVGEGLSTAVGSAVGYAGAGPAVLIALILGTLTVRTGKPILRHLAWAGFLSAGLMATILAISRPFAEQGVGRYAYYTVVFLVPAVALCAQGLAGLTVEPRWLALVIAGALLTGYAVNGLSATQDFTNRWLFISRPERGRVLGMIAAADSGERTLNDSSGLDYDPDVNPARLTDRHIRPALPQGKATEKGRLDAEALYMVAVGTRTRVDRAAEGVGSLADSFEGDLPTAGCSTVRARVPRPALVIGTGQGVEITVRSDSTKVVTQLARGGDGVTSLERTWKVEPGKLYVSTTAKDALLFVAFNGAGDYEVCIS